MESTKEKDIEIHIQDVEATANRYVMWCFSVTMLVYFAVFILNVFGIFTIEKGLMVKAFGPSVVVYAVMFIIYKKMQLTSKNVKFFMLTSTMIVFTVSGIFITYHTILVSMLPFLYATLYSNKKVMWYVFVFTVFSTILQVYGGYYWGLCDANMVLLTSDKLSAYVENGKFVLDTINNNPVLNLALFFVLPRCLIYIAFMSICTSIFRILSKSLAKAKLTEEMQMLKDEAERANKAKSQFLARVSHEIRTPINAIIGMNEMIIRESDNAEVRKYADDAKNSSIILLNIINEILDASKIESGKFEVMPVNYEIGSLFNDIYNMISIKSKEKGLELKFDIDTTMPANYIGDVRMIRQVLINLLNNAVKYTDEGSVSLSCTYTRVEQSARIRFAVIDTGIGIKEEDLDKLTEEFSRFDMEKNKDVEGTGLGMSIVKSFLQLMGSELVVKSEYGKGSEFSFEVIQEIANEAPLKSFIDDLHNSNKEEPVRCEYVAPKARVLVVDDYKMNLKVVRSLLKRTEIEIVEALSGKECISILEREKFDMVFLDHMMPEMDGVETLGIIKEKALCENTPVVMLTANAIVGNKEKYLAKGFDDFVSKPIIPAKLDEVILKHLPKELVVLKKDIMESDEAMAEVEFDYIKDKLSYLDFSVVDTTCCGDVEFYMELFHDFSELNIQEELNGFLEAKDAKNYCIRVHGFKNTAYTIGVRELGDLALKLEKITKDGFNEEVQMLHNELIEQYEEICKVYRDKR